MYKQTEQKSTNISKKRKLFNRSKKSRYDMDSNSGLDGSNESVNETDHEISMASSLFDSQSNLSLSGMFIRT